MTEEERHRAWRAARAVAIQRGAREFADDIAQEAFMRIWPKRNELSFPFIAAVCGAARNIVRQHFRTAMRRPAPHRLIGDPTPESATGSLRRSIDAIEHQRLLALVATLPPYDRLTLRLCLSGRTATEVAMLLDEPRGSTGPRITRIKQRLQKMEHSA